MGCRWTWFLQIDEFLETELIDDETVDEKGNEILVETLIGLSYLFSPRISHQFLNPLYGICIVVDKWPLVQCSSVSETIDTQENGQDL